MKAMGNLVKMLMLIASLALFGCGSSSDSTTSLAGNVIFPPPVVASAAKAAIGDLFLEVEDLAGNIIESNVKLTQDAGNADEYTYKTGKLARNKDYILIAVRDNQEMIAIVDKGSLAKNEITQEVSAKTTATAILIEKWLNDDGIDLDNLTSDDITKVSQMLANQYKPTTVAADVTDALVEAVENAISNEENPFEDGDVAELVEEQVKPQAPSVPTPGATYEISGKITDAAGKGIAGITVNIEGKTATTNADGKYSFTGLGNKTYAITTAKEGMNFSPSRIDAKVANKNLADQDFIQLVETTATLASNNFFTFITGAIVGGVPSEIMYNDVDGELLLPHSVALQVTSSYDEIIKAPYGKYKDSNYDNDVPFPAKAGTVYVFRSFTWGDGETTEEQLKYYKLEITEATKKVGDTLGAVKFKYAEILAPETVSVDGEWDFPANNNAHLSVLNFATMLDFHPSDDANDPMYSSGSLSYTSKDTIEGRSIQWVESGSNIYDTSAKFTLKANGKLDVLLKIGTQTFDLKDGVKMEY